MEHESLLVDWTIPDTYSRVLDQRVDIVIATDVIYKGSPYENLADLLLELARRNERVRILIVIPKQREYGPDFLEKMRSRGFTWEVRELTEEVYRLKALDNQKDSDKFYPGLKELDFDIYTF